MKFITTEMLRGVNPVREDNQKASIDSCNYRCASIVVWVTVFGNPNLQDDVAAQTPRPGNTVSAAELKVTFSPLVLEALGDIAAIARMSKHFDPGIAEKIHEWSMGQDTNVHDIMTALPTMAGEVANHIRATGDERMVEAWEQFSMQMAEAGFSLSQSRRRVR